MLNLKKFASAVLAVLTMSAMCSCTAEKEFRLGTGNIGGVYYVCGRELAELQSGIAVRTTAGSCANLRLLDENFIDLAIVQSDVLSEAVSGTEDFENNPVTTVRAVAGLYDEFFQIIVRADSRIEELSDLRGKTISVGEEGSGVSKNAEHLFMSAGISISSLNRVYMSYRQSAEALIDGTIDAFFAVVGFPSDIVGEIAESTEIRILSFDDRTVSYMTGIYGGYFAAAIPAGTYSGQTEDIRSVGVKAVLVADSGTDESRINSITQSLIENGIRGSEISAEYAVSDIPCAFHKGAADYYATVGVKAKTNPEAGENGFVFGSQDN